MGVGKDPKDNRIAPRGAKRVMEGIGLSRWQIWNVLDPDEALDELQRTVAMRGEQEGRE